MSQVEGLNCADLCVVERLFGATSLLLISMDVIIAARRLDLARSFDLRSVSWIRPLP